MISKKILSLPFGPYITKQEQDKVLNILKISKTIMKILTVLVPDLSLLKPIVSDVIKSSIKCN